MGKRVVVKRRKAVGFISIQSTGCRINGLAVPDVDLSTEIYEGETLDEAIERAKREQLRAGTPAPQLGKQQT